MKGFLPKPTDVIRRPAFASGSPTIEQLAARIVAGGIEFFLSAIVAVAALLVALAFVGASGVSPASCFFL